ncbi:MAG: signal transduction histidine kinase LytS [Chitinophagaceae bacterium]|nr:signal transduction histidine kinase LytS [Chitinophagaceae bacterium]
MACAVLCVWLWKQLVKAKKDREQAAVRYRELEIKVQSLELETIRYKLNPHLFKNTLNSIQSHAYQTYYALDKLSNVLDYILYESDKQYVSLREEIEFALSLIEINRLKVSPLFDLRIKNKIDQTNPLYEQVLIAPLITIDLIENAFKHADIQSADAFISIVFDLKDDQFLLTVSNKISTKSAMKKERSGFGKESFLKRLEIIYQKSYSIDQFIEEDTYISHLKINLLEHKTQMLVAGR